MKAISVLVFFAVTYAIISAARDSGNKSSVKNTSSLESKKDTPIGDISPNIANISLCGSDRAYIIPFSVVLPDVTTINGYDSNRDNNDIIIKYLQDRFDIFSWQTFIALNWPADAAGIPDTTACFTTTNTGLSVWETWMPSTKIFVPADQKPAEWKSSHYSNVRLASADHSNKLLESANIASQAALNSGNFSILRIAKVDTTFSESDGLAIIGPDKFPVVDQNHNYTLYENFFNRQAYDYVVKSSLYSIAGQLQFTKTWPSYTKGLEWKISGRKINIEDSLKRAYFPVGNIKPRTQRYNDTTYTFSKNEGAIIIKSAWIILTDTSEYKNYFTRTVNHSTLGLVGMHIAHKVAEAPQWVWSSFEHVNNAPLYDSNTHKAILGPGVDYLYFNEQDTNKSLYNKHPDSKHFSQPNPADRKPTQVVRMYPSLRSTDSINDQFHELIAKKDKNSVWLHYRLVGTQWNNETSYFKCNKDSCDFQPKRISNAILETYSQQISCMDCHSQACFLSSYGGGYGADFIMELHDVK